MRIVPTPRTAPGATEADFVSSHPPTPSYDWHSLQQNNATTDGERYLPGNPQTEPSLSRRTGAERGVIPTRQGVVVLQTRSRGRQRTVEGVLQRGHFPQAKSWPA